MKYSNILLIHIFLLSLSHLAKAQTNTASKAVNFKGQDIEVVQVYDEIEIAATLEEAWEKIAMEFAQIGDFHSGMKYSYASDKSLRNGLGALRYCHIDDKTYVKEKITAWDEAAMRYTYEIFETKGSPYLYRKCTFKVISKMDKTWLIHEMDYKLKGTNYRQKKMKRANRNLLLAYRNYIEQEDVSKPRFKELERRYANALESVRMLEGFAFIDF